MRGSEVARGTEIAGDKLVPKLARNMSEEPKLEQEKQVIQTERHKCPDCGKVKKTPSELK